jgi:hypothetical protein
VTAELILGICDRFHKLPSEVYREDASLMSLLAIEALAKPPQSPDYGEDGFDG